MDTTQSTERDFNSPAAQIIQRDDDRRSTESSAEDPTSSREAHAASDASERPRRFQALPCLVAVIIGVNEGYNMNTNTTHIGDSLNDTQSSVLVLLPPAALGSLAPCLLLAFGSQSSEKPGILAGMAATTFGFWSAFLSTWSNKTWPVGLSLGIASLGTGLLNLLILLKLRTDAATPGAYSLQRALYLLITSIGKIIGALIAVVLGLMCGWFDRPWKVPYLVEAILGLALCICIYAGILLPQPGTAAPQEPGSDLRFGSGASEWYLGLCYLICSIAPAVTSSLLAAPGKLSRATLAVGAVITLMSAALFLEGWFRKSKDQLTFPMYMRKWWPIPLLVWTRVVLIFTARTMAFRLPFLSSIGTTTCTDKGPGDERSDHQTCHDRYKQFNARSDFVLPVYYLGELVGEFVPFCCAYWVARIMAGSSKRVPFILTLAIALSVYLCTAWIIGSGAIDRDIRLMLETGHFAVVLSIVFVAGIANGAVDNCVSVLLFEYAGAENTFGGHPDTPALRAKRARASAESFSAFGANVASAVALVTAKLRFEVLLTSWMCADFGEDQTCDPARKVLERISNVCTLTSATETSRALRWARGAVERNFGEAAFASTVGSVLALLVLLVASLAYLHRTGSILASNEHGPEQHSADAPTDTADERTSLL